MRKIVIRNERDAVNFLQKAINQEIGDQKVSLEFEQWPVIQIKLEGEGYDSTITPDMAAALVGIQQAVNRSYARVVHRSTNARSLTSEERQSLQFKAKVEKGSSLISVDLGQFAEKLAVSVVDKMTPTHLIITVLGTALIGGGVIAYKAFLKNRSEAKALDNETKKAIALSTEETRRLEIVTRAMKRVPMLEHAKEDFDEARNEIVRATSDADSLTVNSVKLSSESARIIGITKRTEAQEVQLNGNYLIAATDLRDPVEIKLRVRRKRDGLEFIASFLDNSFGQEQIKLLQDAEWSRKTVYLSINARTVRGEITGATVISVKVQPDAA